MRWTFVGSTATVTILAASAACLYFANEGMHKQRISSLFIASIGKGEVSSHKAKAIEEKNARGKRTYFPESLDIHRRLLILEQSKQDAQNENEHEKKVRGGGETYHEPSVAVEALSPRDAVGMIDRYLEAEILDEEWASATEKQIKDALVSSIFSHVSIYEMACKRSLCRVSLSFDEQGDISALLGKIDRTKPFSDGAAFVFLEDSDSRKALYYFARPGHSLSK